MKWAREMGSEVDSVRWLLLAIGWLCTLGGAALMVLYHFPHLQLTSTYAAMGVPLIPYGVLAWTLATVLFAFAGRRHQGGGGAHFGLSGRAALLGEAVLADCARCAGR